MKKLITLAALTLGIMTFGVHVEASPFQDVKKDDWFYNGVVAAKESGLMNGVSDTEFAPSSTLSVAQGVTVAARIHSLFGEKTIPSDFQGYDYYIDYAENNGILPKGYFDDTSRPIRRDELSFIIGNSLEDDLLTQKNDVKYIPDANIGSEYYENLLKLYNAGILGGFDEYGSFLPDNNLTRAELSVVLDRILNPSSRLTNEFVDISNREAYYLIDDFLMKTSVRSIPDIASGWRYDYTGDTGINSFNTYQNVLADKLMDDHVGMSRAIYPQFGGKVTLELIYTIISGTDGVRFFFTDNNGNEVIEIYTKDSSIFVKGSADTDTGIASVTGKTSLKLILDLDSKKALVYINGKYIGEYGMAENSDGIAKLHAETSDKAVTTVSVDHVHLYKNFLVNDVFRLDTEKSVPSEYEISGNMTVEKTISDNDKGGDLQAVKITADGENPARAYKAFPKFTDTDSVLCFETYVLLPKGADGGYVALKNGSTNVVKVTSQNGQWVCGGATLRRFTPNIWQAIRIEADLGSKRLVVKINGKTVAENVPFTDTSIDGIEIGFEPSRESVMWFDDVEVKRLYEYDDYVPQPRVLETDYTLSMMVCSLWRNGSHYGWDYIAPFDEITPVTGYYDEGNPEAMDWEIKFLTEHGFSDYHLCWYAPVSNASEPIKKPRMSDALHDGYFNAKYSHLLSFSIMWENAGYADKNLDNFKNNIWKYWCEWYFTDDRYLKIDGKPFLSIYQVKTFYEMCSNNPTVAKELLNWMHEDIKNYGFDDIIIAFSSNGRLKNENELFKELGIDTVHTYAWGSGAGKLEINKSMVNSGFSGAKEYSVNAIGVASPGLNTFAWNRPRTSYLNPTDFEKLLVWFRDDYLTRFSADTWQSRFMMFDNWNEFGEGHYLYPAKIGGFGYLDAAARVFGKNTFDNSVNILPTQGQKRRIGTLFPAVTTNLKREQNIAVPVLQPQTSLCTFDFTNLETTPLFTTSNMKNHGYNSTAGAFVFEAITSDPIMWYGKQTDRVRIVSADETDVIHIRMKSDAVSQGQIFFVTDTETNWDEAKSIKFEIEKTDEYIDYYIDTKSNIKWKGDIYGIRFDPNTVSGSSGEIKVIEFMRYAEKQQPFKVVIDGVNATVLRDEVREYNHDEMYLCFKHESGLFTLLLTSYEWNRNTGVLTLDTKYGVKFQFTVGSDRALVDGKTVQLDKNVEMYDGTVILPMLFLLDNAGYDYIYAPDKKVITVYVNIKGQEKEDIPENSWKYETNEGLSSFFSPVKLEKDKVYILDFDIELTSDKSNIPVTVTFGDKNNGQTVQAGSISKSDGRCHMNAACAFTSTAESSGITIAAPAEFKASRIVLHKRPVPFTIKNGDAEGNDTTAFYNSNSSINSVEIITDPLNADNKVWFAKNTKTDAQSWSYIRQNAFFEKGVTYEVEFDIRLVSLSDGRPVISTNVVINPRYFDTSRTGIKNPHDHNVMAVKGLGSSQEWTHIKKTFTVSEGFEISDEVQQQFTVYVEPVDGLGVSFMIDNVVVRVP